MNKDLIQARFSKNLKNYDDNAKIQKRMANNLINYIEKKTPEKILEIGCGTGMLTKLICKNTSFVAYKTIDIVEDCKDYIKEINQDLKFECIDIEKYLTENSEKFDLIISNATLQWVNDFENTVNNLIKALNQDGELIFTTFGKENFREIYHTLGIRLNYYSSNELADLFSEYNIKTEEEIHILAFNTPKEVLKHLQLTGVNGIENRTWTKKDLIKFENNYANLCSNKPTLTYNPIYVKITKP